MLPSLYLIQAPAPIVEFEPSLKPSTTIKDLVGGPRVFLPFHLIGVGFDFLKTDPVEWETNDDFMKLRKFVSTFRVVNDTAERAIQMFSDYYGKVTKDEADRQCLMATVRQQRREKSCLNRDVLTAKYATQSE